MTEALYLTEYLGAGTLLGDLEGPAEFCKHSGSWPSLHGPQFLLPVCTQASSVCLAFLGQIQLRLGEPEVEV